MHKTSKNLDQWLAYLTNLYPQEIDLGLERVRQVATRLNIITPQIKIITVGGTNGKGSITAMLESIARVSHIKTGLFTSPHFISYTERIKIAGQNITEAELIGHFTAIEQARRDIKITYFEFGALAAMLSFVKHKIELAILEVGLGGRLDAVNIWDADVSLISTIGIDHQDFLGDNREDIGFEKAGILRTGRPAIIGETSPPLSIVNHAQKIGADLQILNRDFFYERGEGGWDWFDQRLRHTQLSPLVLAGDIQYTNASCAIKALTTIYDISKKAIDKGLQQTRLPGRLQTLKYQGRELLIDVAHNAQAAKILADFIAANPVKGKNIALFSMLADKNIAEVLSIMSDHIDQWNIIELNSSRAASAQQLIQLIKKDARVFADSKQALNKIISLTSASDRIIIFGSFYLVAEILALCLPESDKI